MWNVGKGLYLRLYVMSNDCTILFDIFRDINKFIIKLRNSYAVDWERRHRFFFILVLSSYLFQLGHLISRLILIIGQYYMKPNELVYFWEYNFFLMLSYHCH